MFLNLSWIEQNTVVIVTQRCIDIHINTPMLTLLYQYALLHYASECWFHCNVVSLATIYIESCIAYNSKQYCTAVINNIHF